MNSFGNIAHTRNSLLVFQWKGTNTQIIKYVKTMDNCCSSCFEHWSGELHTYILPRRTAGTGGEVLISLHTSLHLITPSHLGLSTSPSSSRGARMLTSVHSSDLWGSSRLAFTASHTVSRRAKVKCREKDSVLMFKFQAPDWRLASICTRWLVEVGQSRGQWLVLDPATRCRAARPGLAAAAPPPAWSLSTPGTWWGSRWTPGSSPLVTSTPSSCTKWRVTVRFEFLDISFCNSIRFLEVKGPQKRSDCSEKCYCNCDNDCCNPEQDFFSPSTAYV